MAIEERFTELPIVANAKMTDLICAVQDYVSPSSLGTSVQESLQQVYNLFQSNVILFNAGNPNGAVAGNTYQLCWDTVNTILYVCVTSGTTSTAVWDKAITLTAGTGITVSQAGNTITISTSGTVFSWVEVTGTTQAMLPEHGYIANNAGLVTLTLPITASLGDSLIIQGKGTGLFRIAQNASQAIGFGNTNTVTGTGGSLTTTSQYDALELVCITANSNWAVTTAQGNITVV